MYCSWLSNNGVFENTLKLLNIALCYNAIHTCTVSVMVVFSLSLSSDVSSAIGRIKDIIKGNSIVSF